jgi:transposase
METKFMHFAGIDVSKNKLDVCLIVNSERTTLHYGCFEQSSMGFKAMKRWLAEHTGKGLDNLLVLVENTGLYDDALLDWLWHKKIAVCLENAANIKRSIRDTRSKNDKVDSRNIALYLLQHFHELHLWDRPREVIRKLKLLLTQRANRVESLKRLSVLQKEWKRYEWSGVHKIKSYDAGIKGLQADIEAIEKDLWELIKSDSGLQRMFLLIVSIPAVGRITAMHFICYTNEFKTVHSGKQLAAYCGVVPFEKSSGKSVKWKPKLPQQANKVLKTLLHLCATTAIRMKGDFAAYYRRKTSEGKPALIALNGIRNKLALTIAAVIRTGQSYTENYIYQNCLVKP